MTGGQTVLNDDVKSTILRYLRAGVSYKTAAAAARVSDRSVANWLRRGRQARERLDAGEDIPDSEWLYVNFVSDCDFTQADVIVTAAAQVRQAGAHDWKAALSILERRAPEDWTPRREVTGPQGQPIQVEAVMARAEILLERVQPDILKLPPPYEIYPDGDGDGDGHH
jgi:hypothetical protein